jgi:hypothetical protein
VQGSRRLGGVSEPVQLTQPDRAMASLDVTKHTTGADRGELLIITDQPDTAATLHNELDGGAQGEGVGHAGFVNNRHRGPGDAVRPVGQVSVVDGSRTPGQRFG